VESEEEHGFLPGDQREKMEPFVASILDIIDKLIGKGSRLALEEAGYLEIMALAYVRGKSIDNAIFILDEAQNTSPSQMKTVLTRIGYNSKFVITGDLDQSDRYRHIHESGLYDAIKKHKNIPEIGFIEFDLEDIVRNKLISKILENYKQPEFVQKPKVVLVKPEKKLPWWKKFLNWLH
jgi:phosphate starvation-inducible PhoH-like protein